MTAKEQAKRLRELAWALHHVECMPWTSSVSNALFRVLKLLELCPWITQEDGLAALVEKKPATARSRRKKEAALRTGTS